MEQASESPFQSIPQAEDGLRQLQRQFDAEIQRMFGEPGGRLRFRLEGLGFVTMNNEGLLSSSSPSSAPRGSVKDKALYL